MSVAVFAAFVMPVAAKKDARPGADAGVRGAGASKKNAPATQMRDALSGVDRLSLNVPSTVGTVIVADGATGAVPEYTVVGGGGGAAAVAARSPSNAVKGGAADSIDA